MRKRPRLRIRITRSWPLLLWLVATAAAVVLYARNVKPVAIQGLVATVDQVVASPDAARVAEILVRTGQAVKAGDPVARLDATLLDAEAAVDEVRLIQAEMGAVAEHQAVLETMRRVDDACASAKADLQMEIINRDRDTALLAGLRKEQSRLEALAAKGLASDQEMGVLRPQIEELTAAVAAYPALITALEERLSAALRSREAMNSLIAEGSEGGSALEETRRRGDALRAELKSVRERWDRRKDAFTLRASLDGVVSVIHVHGGSVAPAGIGILRIVSPTASRAVAFLPEALSEGLRTGERVTVTSSSRGTHTGGVIASIAPEVESVVTEGNQPLLGNLLGVNSQPLRVRRLIVDLDPEHGLLPGETVTVRPMQYTAWKSLLPEWLGNRKGGKE